MAVPYGQTLQYQLLFGYMTGAWATQAVVVSISDTTCFYLLGEIFNKLNITYYFMNLDEFQAITPMITESKGSGVLSAGVF